ncbi:MAG: hypothetical protein KGL46_10645 [Hyphomicrobiales bacterium]|nr:hypothetical protein [Hyphomicrobiales bacterium]
MFDIIALAVSATLAHAPLIAPWRGAVEAIAPAAPVFRASDRAVDNWRREGALNLDIGLEASAQLLAGRDIKGLSRCVKLNNYWCIKKAGWPGEIASDSEGHVAFASAREGAAVAALLLRRYYIDYRLKSARAIVQRWAPAQCGGAVVARRGRAGRALAGRMNLGPEPKGLTTRGLGSTVRARWLARHGQRPHRSVVPDRLAGASMRTPTIAAGIGSAEPVRLAMLPFPGVALGPAPGVKAAPLPPLPALPARSCPSENARILNYATNMASGVAAGPDADLKLFEADGKPTAVLAQVLFNMAGVEIGPLGARRALVEKAMAAAFPAAPPLPAAGERAADDKRR